MVQSQKNGHGGRALACPVCWYLAFVGAACEALGDCGALGLAGAARLSWQRWLRQIGSTRPHGRWVLGRLGWPKRQPTGLLLPPRSLQKKKKKKTGFGKPTCCQISAPIIFFKRKGIIFVLRTSTSALSLLSCVSLSHTHTFFAALGNFSSAGL